jgi:hypothetical protein
MVALTFEVLFIAKNEFSLSKFRQVYCSKLNMSLLYYSFRCGLHPYFMSFKSKKKRRAIQNIFEHKKYSNENCNNYSKTHTRKVCFQLFQRCSGYKLILLRLYIFRRLLAKTY